MARTTAGAVWYTAIKEIGNGWIKLIAQITDPGGGGTLPGTGMAVSTTAGNLTIFVTADPDWLTGISIAEACVNTDRYALVKKKGAEIKHNQKLAGAYQIGACVYLTAAGTWDHVDHGVGASLLVEVGIVCGPVDRVTAGVLKGIDDALTATEPVDICV